MVFECTGTKPWDQYFQIYRIIYTNKKSHTNKKKGGAQKEKKSKKSLENYKQMVSYVL